MASPNPDSRSLDSRHVEHAVVIAAPPQTVYDLVADVVRWPSVFPPTIHAVRVAGDTHHERIRLWATANDEVKTWTSRRELDPSALTVTFRQEVSAPPVGSMGGAWMIQSNGSGGTRVVLTHDYAPVNDDPAAWSWIEAAIERNSLAELDALREAAERAAGGNRMEATFADAVHVDGAADEVYSFLWDAHLWRERLGHVARVDLRSLGTDLQMLEMDTRAVDGSTHTTRSVRVGFAPDRLVYKQLLLPALLRVHIGQWSVEPAEGGGLTVTSTHTVSIRTAAVPKVLGPKATLADAHAFVRRALGTNSTATLTRAKEFVERQRSHR